MTPFTDAGCQGALTFSPDSNWDGYISLAKRADGPKSSLVARFDPLAAARGLKSDWTVDDV